MTVDNHQNDRLLSLEGAVRDMSSQTGRATAQLEILTQNVSKGFDEFRISHKELSAEQAALSKRIVPFEEAKIRNTRYKDTAKKLLIAGLVASAGVFGTVAGKTVVTWIGGLFGH